MSETTSELSVFCTDEILIDAAPETVAQCIATAARILDYYPTGFHSRQLSPLQSACFGVIGASLLEIDEQRDGFIRLTAYNALPVYRKGCRHTLTAGQLKAASFFTMVEDWQLNPVAGNPQQTRLLKSWHSLKQPKLKLIPAVFIKLFVRVIACMERRQLIKRWSAS